MILSEAEVPGWRLLIPPPQEIWWSLIFLVIFAGVFMKFVRPRMNAVLEGRAEMIVGGGWSAGAAQRAASREGGIRTGQRGQEQVAQLKSGQEQELAAARQEAASIREKARADGQQIGDEARARADAESERVLAAGRQQLS